LDFAVAGVDCSLIGSNALQTALGLRFPSISLGFCQHPAAIFHPPRPLSPFHPWWGGGNLLHLNCTRSGAETVDDVGQPEEFFFCVL